MNIAIFCSGYGSNFQAIIDAHKKKVFSANIAVMVCDNKNAFVLERAGRENIKTLVVSPENFRTKEDLENKIISQLEKDSIDLICLAGFMRILSSDFVRKYKNRILNIHPTLLPSFKGANGIKDAFEYGVKITGVTVHIVTEKLDSGPVILQEAVVVREDDTQEMLEEKIHAIEHKLYPEVIRLFVDGKLTIKGQKVNIK